jgi:hypothetical protein
MSYSACQIGPWYPIGFIDGSIQHGQEAVGVSHGQEVWRANAWMACRPLTACRRHICYPFLRLEKYLPNFPPIFFCWLPFSSPRLSSHLRIPCRSLATAFTDLKALMQQAEEMVALAERFRGTLAQREVN